MLFGGRYDAKYPLGARWNLAATAILALAVLAGVGCGGRRGTSGPPLAASWPMFRGDAQNTGRSPCLGPERPYVKWQSDNHGLIATLVGADGSIYTSFGTVAALEPSGTVQWVLPALGSGVPGWGAALGSDGTVYVTGGRFLRAFDPNGKAKWKLDAGMPKVFVDESGVRRRSIRCVPVLGPDETIYFGGGDNKLYAVNDAGKVKWEFQAESQVDGIPAVSADGTVYFAASSGQLYAVDSRGAQKWRRRVTRMRRGYPSFPAIGGDGAVYVSDPASRTLVAIRPDGSTAWRHAFRARGSDREWGSAPVAIARDGTVYAIEPAGRLWALRPDGTGKWSFGDRSALTGLPVTDGDGAVYAVNKDFDLVAIDSKGRLKWRLPLRRLRYPDSWGSLPGVLVIGGDGTVYCASIAIGDRS